MPPTLLESKKINSTFVASASYAFFTAGITGSESNSTIKARAGEMTINYNGGANLELAGIYPSDIPWITKNFTVTGKNTTELVMYYKVRLIVDENTFRFDFTYSGNMSDDKIIETEVFANEMINQNIIVSTEVLPIEQAKKLGAMALFGDKYGEKVRVVKIGKSLETKYPSAIRRNVAFSEAIYEGSQTIEDMTCFKANSIEEAECLLNENRRSDSHWFWTKGYLIF